jgi:hypothetical protein
METTTENDEICRWCGASIHESYHGECFNCWSLRIRIEKNPELAKTMIAGIPS